MLFHLLCRESASLCSLVQSVIPTRSHLSVKGDALHEYLSSLSQISRSEANRLSENLHQSQRRRFVKPLIYYCARPESTFLWAPHNLEVLIYLVLSWYICRVRVSKNYLTTAAPSLNPEDLSLLNQYNCFQKVSPQNMEEVWGRNFCQWK